jgi:hypothetical protein
MNAGPWVCPEVIRGMIETSATRSPEMPRTVRVSGSTTASGPDPNEVMVADPNFAPMYATRTRKVKTDRRDARALTEANVLGAYRPAHRLSDGQRHVRAQLAVRDA